MRLSILCSVVIGIIKYASSQSIDLDYVNGLPDPTYTIIPDLPFQVISYNEAAAVSTAFQQAIATPVTPEKRAPLSELHLEQRNEPCSPVPTTQNQYNATLSPPSAFRSDESFAEIASSAPVPAGYGQTFSNLQASSQANGYMGYALAPSYEPEWCANRCNITSGCQAFNLYFQRDPVVAVAEGCPNPDATANIVCTLWGGPVSADNARNTGQHRHQFEVVMAGSNGYVLTATPTVYGYAPPSPLASRAVNAPLDCNNNDSYMGMRLFNDNSPFEPDRCAAVCRATSDFNTEHAGGRPPKLCKFFNTYILNKNGVSQGQACAMYSQYWDPQRYATNDGQWDSQGNRYSIQSSYTFYNATDIITPVCPSDITSLRSDTVTAGPFCTSYNSYVAPVSTAVTSTTTTVQACAGTPRARRDAISGNTKDLAERDDEASNEAEIVNAVLAVWQSKDEASPTATPALVTIPGASLTASDVYASASSAAAEEFTASVVQKRQARATPSVLSGRNSLEISSVCSQVATGTATTTRTAVATQTAYDYCADQPTSCNDNTLPQVIVGSLVSSLVSIDDVYYTINLPFPLCIYDFCSRTVHPSTNGLISLGTSVSAAYTNTPIPAFSGQPFLYALWDDLYVYSGQKHYMDYSVCGPVGNRTVTFDWRMGRYAAPSNGPLYSFSATFYEDEPAKIYLGYFTTTDRGSSATVGIEGKVGGVTRSYQYSHNSAVITNGLGLIFDYHGNYFGRAN